MVDQAINGVIYERCIYESDLYHTINYRPGKKLMIIQLDSDEYAQIMAIIYIDNQCYIDVQKVITENVFHTFHIFKVLGYSESSNRFSISEIKDKLLIIKLLNVTYICRVPNIFNM